MSKVIWWLIVFLGIGLLALIVYYALPKTAPEAAPSVPSTATATVPPATDAEPAIRHPVSPRTGEKPLPALDVSDSTMRNALDELLSEKTLVDLFQMRDFVRRVVATIDNIPRNKVALRLLPVKPAGGAFLVAGKNQSLAIAADNAARYAPYLRLANSLDTAKLVALYFHFYPLFQQAYQELGYPKGYFNDRLVEVIDHLLAAPEVAAALKLVRPKVLYLYADPALEGRSAGQKVLLRIGSENAALVRAKLRDIRSELMRQAAAGSRPAVAQ